MKDIIFRALFFIMLNAFFLFGQAPSTLDKNSGPEPPAIKDLTVNPASTGQNPTSLTSDSTDIQVFPSPYQQSEVHISIDKNNPQSLIISSNVFYGTDPNNTQTRTGWYVSHDGGLTWSGADTLPNSFARADPSTAFDLLGNAYVAALMPYTHQPDGWSIQQYNGSSWGNSVRGTGPTQYIDKEMIAIDDANNSSFKNNIYSAWTLYIGGASALQFSAIQFNRSTDQGYSFSTPDTLRQSGNSTGGGKGACVATGPNGEVYVCWADYSNSVHPADNIGFARYTNGGLSFTTFSAFQYQGITKEPKSGQTGDSLFNGTRVNDFPSMAVDKSYGPHRGRIYIAYPNKNVPQDKSEIYLRYSDDDGIEWSVPTVVNISKGRQNWFPWIAVDDQTGDVSIIYYSMDTPVSQGRFLTSTYVAHLDIKTNQWENILVSNAPHTTAPIPGGATAYAGDYIGICAFGGKAYPVWMDDRAGSNGIWQIYVSPLSYGNDIAIKQEYKDGSVISDSKIGQAAYGRFYLKSPDSHIVLRSGETETLLADQTIRNNQKYRVWKKLDTEESSVINFHDFNVPAGFNKPLISQFDQNYSNVKIENYLVSNGSSNTGNISFQDPWLIDYADPAYGNNKRNQGMNAPFKSRQSPFSPDYSTSYNGDVYQGVFLGQGYNQGNWAAPYYSVEALSSQNVSAHGEQITYYFQGWGGTDVQYQSPDNLETPVVFNAANAVAEARYKGHLASSTSSATGPNGSRVVARSRIKYDGYLYGSGKKYIYFMAYADGGEIWYSKAETDDQTTNGNFDWLTEIKVSDGQGGNYNPSVATLGNIVYFTWAQKIGSTWYLRFRYYNNNNNSYYWSPTQTIASFTSTSTPTPQIALTENPVRVMVASNINGYVKTWLRKNGSWQYAGLNVSGSQPALCADNIDAGLLQPDYFGDVALVYTYNGDVYLRNWATSSENWSAAKKVSIQNMFSLGNNRASVSYGDGMAYISWVALNDEIGSHSIYERSWHASTNVFSSQTTVIEDPDDSSDPSVGFDESEYGYETIVYVNGGTVYKAKKTSSWSRTTIGAGRYPSITPYNNETLVYNQYNSAPYLIKHHYEAPAGGGGIFIPKVANGSNPDTTVQLLASRRLIYSFGDASLSLDLSNLRFGGQNLSWRADNHSDTLKAVTSGELTINISTLQKNSIAADRPNETLFTIYFVSGSEETALRSFRLSDLRPTASDKRMGAQRHLLLASRRSRDGYFRIGLGDRKPVEFTVLHASTDMQPLAKTTEAAGSELSLPQSYSLGQNYPNPFNPVTHIRFALPEASDVTLTVYDMTGRAVSTLVNGYKSAGRYDVTFDGSGLASGEYIYRLEAGRNFVETKKLLLVK